MINDLNKIISVMKRAYGKDISIYNRSFLEKSLEKRWIALRLNNIIEYCSHVEQNISEADVLYNSLHNTYSQFFRDPLTFSLMNQWILQSLVNNKKHGSEIRVWSAGCACGQEAYSIAMLLSDLADDENKQINFRIFATDIMKEVLVIGRNGVYGESDILNVTMKHLNKYFIKQGQTYIIDPKLKQRINFSIYDLLDLSSANPPESIYGDFDIVMCNNLLFYYRFDLQQVIIKKLQQSISSSGYLVTGEAEKKLFENNSKLQMITTATAVFKKS